MPNGFHISIEDVLKNLAKGGPIETKVRLASNILCDSFGKRMASYAQANAPWKNRSGKARQTITGGSQWSGQDRCSAYVSGNMEYSPFLELAHAKKSDSSDGIEVSSSPSFAKLELTNEGKYAILRPTIRKFTPQFVKEMGKLLE